VHKVETGDFPQCSYEAEGLQLKSLDRVFSLIELVEARMKLRKEEPLSPAGSSPWKRGAVRGASSKVSALIKLAEGGPSFAKLRIFSSLNPPPSTLDRQPGQRPG
jgi:hypothetical protein